MAARKTKCWNVVITMGNVIWRDLRKGRVEAYMLYGPDSPLVIFDQYLWGDLQADIVINDFLRTQFFHHP